jgi:hypothetical protein
MEVSVRDGSMERRGVRYTIRVGIEPGVWFITIHPGGVESVDKRFHGTRKEAEFEAHSMINEWCRRQSKLKAAGDAELKLKGRNPS